MATSTEQRICGFLNKYLFRNVWNEPRAEYRTNVRLRLLSRRAAVNTYRTRYDMIHLPTTNTPYIMYAMPLEEMAGFDPQFDGWVKLSEFNKNNLLNLQIYDYRGVWLWREAIYICHGTVRDSFLIAVDRKMLLKCVGTIDKFEKLFVTKYFDSDLVNDLHSSYYYINDNSERYNVLANISGATTIYINGHVAQPASVLDLARGDYVEAVRDGNVIAKVVIKIGDPNTYFTYNSTEAQTTRTIIHVPKANNPDNAYITWNTCDVLVQPTGIQNAHLKGLFLHKCDRRWAFQQLTHNDFALDNRIYDEYRDYTGATGLTITVLIRTHNKNNRIVRDINYIDLLYIHDDATIIKFFQGKGPADFEFWTADHLEDSVYGKAMYNVPDQYTPENVGYYIDVLGYNNTLALICDRTKKITISRDGLQAFFPVEIPLLFMDVPLRAIVYHNGLKVPDAQVATQMQTAVTMIVKVLDENGDILTPAKGDEFVIEIFENPDKFDRVYTNIGESTGASITDLTTDDVKFWSKEVAGYFIDIHGNQVAGSYSSEDVTELVTLENNGDGTFTPVFDPSLYTKDIVMTASNGMYKLADYEFTITEDDFELLSTDELRVGTARINLVGQIVYLVYLNGRCLTEGLDYIVAKHMIGQREICSEIVLQNVSFLEETNRVEVYGVRGEARGYLRGFVSGNIVTAPGQAPFWFDNLSMLFVDGLAVCKLESVFGQVFLRSTDHRNGAAYLLRTLVSAGAINTMDKYRTDIDTDRLLRLRDYFVDMEEPEPGIDVIPYSHNIFSIYTNSIVRDYLKKVDGKRVLDIELLTSDVQFLEQFSSYDWLKKYDAVFGEQNFDYIDAYPMFHRTSTDDPTEYHTLMYLFKKVLPADAAKYRDMVYA